VEAGGVIGRGDDDSIRRQRARRHTDDTWAPALDRDRDVITRRGADELRRHDHAAAPDHLGSARRDVLVDVEPILRIDTRVVSDEEDQLRQRDVAESDVERDERALCPDRGRWAGNARSARTRIATLIACSAQAEQFFGVAVEDLLPLRGAETVVVAQVTQVPGELTIPMRDVGRVHQVLDADHVDGRS